MFYQEWEWKKSRSQKEEAITAVAPGGWGEWTSCWVGEQLFTSDNDLDH